MSEIKRYDIGTRMSRAVVYNGVISFCGHVAPKEYVGITNQAVALLARYEELLERFGSDKSHILTATIYLKNINNAPQFNAVWDEWIPQGSAPARCCVQAGMNDESYEVEIVMTAACVHPN